MKKYWDVALSLGVLAYFVYIQATGDNTLRRVRSHGRYHLGKLRRWWTRTNEPAWFDELRKMNDEDYITVDE
jgi:hypothetical protein